MKQDGIHPNASYPHGSACSNINAFMNDSMWNCLAIFLNVNFYNRLHLHCVITYCFVLYLCPLQVLLLEMVSLDCTAVLFQMC